MKFNKLYLLVIAFSLIIVGCDEKQNDDNNDSNVSNNETTVKGETVTISTEYGAIKIELFDDCPKHKENFLKLAKEGFYDGTTFHRVIKTFMIQGGDPNTKDPEKMNLAGQGGPGYTVPAEIQSTHLHVKGALAAARQGDQVNPQKNSSGSQFYLVEGKAVSELELLKIEQQIQGMADPNFKYTDEQKRIYLEQGGVPFLDMQYTVFGQVVEGLDVIDVIAKVSTAPGDRPVTDIKMTVTID